MLLIQMTEFGNCALFLVNVNDNKGEIYGPVLLSDPSMYHPWLPVTRWIYRPVLLYDPSMYHPWLPVTRWISGPVLLSDPSICHPWLYVTRWISPPAVSLVNRSAKHVNSDNQNPTSISEAKQFWNMMACHSLRPTRSVLEYWRPFADVFY